MGKIFRRDLLQNLGALAMMPMARTDPDFILYNGHIWTVNPGTHRAQAVAITAVVSRR